MPASSSRSLTRTTLYRIAAGVTVIIALATGIGYELLSREVGRRVLERLSEYVVQRAKYHGSYLTLIRDHHRVIKAELLRRYAAPMPDADERFEQLMMRYPDGAWRNRPEYLDPKRYSTGWIHKKVLPTPEFRRLWRLLNSSSVSSVISESVQPYAPIIRQRVAGTSLTHAPNNATNGGRCPPYLASPTTEGPLAV